jgi:hypothetical protein
VSTSIEVKATPKPKVDILVVVDNSPSMETEQKNMAARFHSFIDQLDGLDWQLGITTTDLTIDTPLADGRLLEFSGNIKGSVLNSTMNLEEVKNSFGRTIQRPERGYWEEQGIAATFRALERSQAPRDRNNRGNVTLVRPDAALAVIVVTDADETPFADFWGRPQPTVRNSPEGLIKYIQKIWRGKKNFAFHSITVKDGDTACLAQDGNESFGLTYAALSRLTNGLIGNVCESDYGRQLKIMGDKVQGLVRTIRLECAPADIDGDQRPDMLFKTSTGTQLSSYRLENMDVIFTKPLPVGVTTIDYKCEVKNDR